MAACHSLEHRIGGTICIAGWLPFSLPPPQPLQGNKADANAFAEGDLSNATTMRPAPKWTVSKAMRDVPIWLMHGVDDDVIPLGAANNSAYRMTLLGFKNVSVLAYQGREHK